jgi:4-diphosphocytidyl-2-C-methyl-D-erythritol kinase
MLSFPNAKINLGLNIIEKRLDGFHTIETVFYPIGLKDALEFVVKEDHSATSLHISGIKVEGDVSSNLVIKAYNLLSKDFTIPALDIYLQKHIPLGAGLGGGSADAAFMLVMLNTFFKLGLSVSELKSYAIKLGSDCPFFIQNTPVFATGKGEDMSAVNITLEGYYIILVKPEIHSNTALAYALCTPQKPTLNLQDIINKPIETWKGIMENDFEAPIFSLHPQISAIKNELYEKGAIYASMSGSGSSVFGIFKHEIELKNYFPDCFIWQGKLD